MNILVTDADAQSSGLLDMNFGNITCQSLIIKDENGRWRGLFGLAGDDAILEIYGDDRKTSVAYLGGNAADPNGEMMLQLSAKSKTDKRKARMMIDGDGGRFGSTNKMGENVVRIGVGSDGGGTLDLRDKHGYEK